MHKPDGYEKGTNILLLAKRQEVLEEMVFILSMLSFEIWAIIEMQHVVEVMEVKRDIGRKEGEYVSGVYIGIQGMRRGEGDDAIRLLPKVGIFRVMLIEDTDIDEIGGDALEGGSGREGEGDGAVGVIRGDMDVGRDMGMGGRDRGGDEVVEFEAMELELTGVVGMLDVDRIVEGIDKRGFAQRRAFASGQVGDFYADISVGEIGMGRRGNEEGVTGGEVTDIFIIKDGRGIWESVFESVSVSVFESGDIMIIEPTVFDEGLGVVKEEHMIKGFFVERKDMKECIVNCVTNLGKVGDVGVDIDGDIKVRKGEV